LSASCAFLPSAANTAATATTGEIGAFCKRFAHPVNKRLTDFRARFFFGNCDGCTTAEPSAGLFS
jgi:hypothetical protein